MVGRYGNAQQRERQGPPPQQVVAEGAAQVFEDEQVERRALAGAGGVGGEGADEAVRRLAVQPDRLLAGGRGLAEGDVVPAPVVEVEHRPPSGLVERHLQPRAGPRRRHDSVLLRHALVQRVRVTRRVGAERQAVALHRALYPALRAEGAKQGRVAEELEERAGLDQQLHGDTARRG